MLKRWLAGLRMAFGMYTSIPLPGQLWHDDCINLLLPCFPIVGAVIGGIWFGSAYALQALGVDPMLFGALCAVLPFVLTGFLHLDGYMDSSDAILSRRPLEDKLRILKDPHTGAFAVIMLVILMLLQYAAFTVIGRQSTPPVSLIMIPVLSRCLSAYVTATFTPMKQSSYVHMYQEHMKILHRVFILFLAAAALLIFWLTGGISALIVSGAVFIGFAGALAYAWHEFHGISGDLSGFALVTGELMGVLALAFLS